MREILFRGKLKDGEWLFGDLDTSEKKTNGLVYIDDGSLWRENVIEDTIGQYTGRKDKDRKKIFEGDIVDFLCPYGKLRGKVVYNEQRTCFCIEGSNNLSIAMCNCSAYAVLGNIYDDKTTKC